MSDPVPTRPARTRAEHQAAAQAIFDDEHEAQVFLISPAESARVAALHAYNALLPGELIGLLPDGGYQDYSFTYFGRIWSGPRRAVKRNGQLGFHAGNRFLAQGLSANGYLYVSLSEDHGKHTFRGDRLVAQTHLANPRHFLEVNHRDHNRANNYVVNLEWCTPRYNNLFDLLHRPLGTLLGVTEDSHDPPHNRNWHQPFRVQATLNGKSKYIGRYATALEAACAYDDCVFENGIPTWLNFPEFSALDKSTQ
jgi:hypothetical protein